MPQKAATTTQNNFNQGLKTEFTGLNFPENACTETENCTFERVGNVHRRNGFDYEVNNVTKNINRAEQAISTFVWTNVGGDGETKVYVLQVGGTLYFYQLTNATVTNPLSTTILTSTVNIASFVASGGTFDATQECQYTAGNGYLFVFQPTCDPFFCTFTSGTVTGTVITVQVRDFTGIPEPSLQGANVGVRPLPSVVTGYHTYNLENQGWGFNWGGTSGTNIAVGSTNVIIVNSSTLPIQVGDTIAVTYTGDNSIFENGVVTSYVGTTLTFTITTFANHLAPATFSSWAVGPSPDTTGIFEGDLGVYPSNSDQWFTFKDDTNTFNPTATVNNVSLPAGQAPQGHFITPAFDLDYNALTRSSGFQVISTTMRPRTGCWWNGRIFYSGTDASTQVTNGVSYGYTWTENIYFSQVISPGDSTSFGYCYELNDPTSETLSDILPSDGGVIVVQGSGSVYKLFPVVNGLIVFAANGIWFITGSTGIGFTATDYTITKLSGVQSISGRSFIDVLGYPVFWNEESIYSVSQGQEGRGLTVNNLGITTINSFYADIPLSSKQYARGDYNPLTYQIQWVYKSTQATDTTSTYAFDSVLNFNTVTDAFYPWTVSTGSSIHDVTYVVAPGGLNTPDPVFKYLASSKSGSNYLFSFAEERDDTNWVDWHSTGTPDNYVSTFTTGYAIHGDAIRKFQPSYVNVYSNNDVNTSYIIQGVWDYAITPDSGRYSSGQLIQNYISTTNFNVVRRRHRIRGSGYVLQFLITSVEGMPFDIIGWGILETQNAGT